MNAIAQMQPLGQLTGFGGSARPVLSKKQKAAIIVRLLSAEGLKVPLTDLSEDQQTQLTEHIAAMKLVDKETLQEVVEEF